MMGIDQFPPDNVISLDERITERRVGSLMSELQVLEDKVLKVADEFLLLMETDPEEAISKISEWTYKIKAASVAEGVSVAYVESLVGPNHDNTSLIANILAEHYDTLTAEQRIEVVTSQVFYLSRINCIYSQMHVGKINNPRLIRDITISAPLYWPGLDAELDFFETQPDIESFNKYAQSCRSIGLLAFTVLLKEAEASLPIKYSVEKYAPEVFDGVLDLAAAKAYHYGARKLREGSMDMIDAIEHFISKQFAPEYWDRIRFKVAESNWVRINDPYHPITDEEKLPIIILDGRLDVGIE